MALSLSSRLISALIPKPGLRNQRLFSSLFCSFAPRGVSRSSSFPAPRRPVCLKQLLISRNPDLSSQETRAISTLLKRNVTVVSITKRGEEEASPNSQVQRGVSTSSPPSQQADATHDQGGNMLEATVCKVGDLQDGQMKEVELGEHKVLILKEEGQFHAMGNKCTHYGAPLSKGAYRKGVVRCPWHGACFNVKTGDIEDFPGLDSLHVFQVDVKGDDVVVKADPAAFENFRRVKAMVKKNPSNQKSVVIVGGGPTSVVAAETLRQEGFTGKITIVSKENCLPYDRIKLSKAMGVKPEDIALRKAEFYAENGIDMVLGKEVTKVEPTEKKIILDNGDSITFSSLLLATGGQPRKLPIKGADLKNIFLLRTPEDANSIAEVAKGKNVVILGSSFIGMEVTAFLADKAASVNCVDLVSTPFQMTLGEKLGHRLKEIHEGKGVKFHMSTSIEEFVGEDGRVVKARLANGTVLDADVCIMGVGVVPTTNFLKDSGIDMTSRGFVTVDKHMRTNVSDVYAGGDIVEFPLFTVGDNNVNVQHWQMAHHHGRIAGLNIAGKEKEIRSVPYFWTVQYGMSIRYTGYGPGYDDVIVHGDLSQNKFVAYYTKGESVVAVASLGWDPIVSQAAEFFQNGGSISKEEITSEPSAWTSRL